MEHSVAIGADQREIFDGRFDNAGNLGKRNYVMSFDKSLPKLTVCLNEAKSANIATE